MPHADTHDPHSLSSPKPHDDFIPPELLQPAPRRIRPNLRWFILSLIERWWVYFMILVGLASFIFCAGEIILYNTSSIVPAHVTSLKIVRSSSPSHPYRVLYNWVYYQFTADGAVHSDRQDVSHDV